MKRLFDFALASAGLLVSAPLLAAIAIAIRVSSPGPVLYRGRRIGLGGRPFPMLKFRSMVVDAERLGGSATANDDARITPVGRWLRRYKLDELPQLVNVVKGEMSFVGPRPEVQKYCDMYSARERAILTVKPGITDWASIWNSDEGAVLEASPDPERAYEELIRPTKIALQLEYVRVHSFSGDLAILFHTAMKLLKHDWVPAPIAGFGQVRRYRTS